MFVSKKAVGVSNRAMHLLSNAYLSKTFYRGNQLKNAKNFFLHRVFCQKSSIYAKYSFDDLRQSGKWLRQIDLVEIYRLVSFVTLLIDKKDP
jgi:hypothetical protein